MQSTDSQMTTAKGYIEEVSHHLERFAACLGVDFNNIMKPCDARCKTAKSKLRDTGLDVPITSKNALGSMPRADEKSVPVFLSECIAARMPCTAATQDTREKTEQLVEQVTTLLVAGETH